MLWIETQAKRVYCLFEKLNKFDRCSSHWFLREEHFEESKGSLVILEDRISDIAAIVCYRYYFTLWGPFVLWDANTPIMKKWDFDTSAWKHCF